MWPPFLQFGCKAQYSQVGCHFNVSKGCLTRFRVKKDVYHTGGQLGRKSGGQGDLHFDNLDTRRNIVKWGVILMVPKGAWLDSGLKKDVHHTGGHLGRKSGDQSDLHLDNLDIRRIIVKWGVMLMVSKDAWLDSRLKKDVHHTGSQLGRKMGCQSDLHFYNLI